MGSVGAARGSVCKGIPIFCITMGMAHGRYRHRSGDGEVFELGIVWGSFASVLHEQRLGGVMEMLVGFVDVPMGFKGPEFMKGLCEGSSHGGLKFKG